MQRDKLNDQMIAPLGLQIYVEKACKYMQLLLQSILGYKASLATTLVAHSCNMQGAQGKRPEKARDQQGPQKTS